VKDKDFLAVWKLARSQGFVQKTTGVWLDCDWSAKRLLPLKILLLMSIKLPLKGYKPVNMHVSLFVNVLSISDDIMHYQ